MQADDARARFAAAQVARLATVGADGSPHLVAICFAVEGDRIVTAIDHKPKRTTRLRRLANIAANPSVSLLVDHYDAGRLVGAVVGAGGRLGPRAGARRARDGGSDRRARRPVSAVRRADPRRGP